MRRRTDSPAGHTTEPAVTYINHPTGVWDIYPMYGAPPLTRREAQQNFTGILNTLHPTQTHTLVQVLRESLLDFTPGNGDILAPITTHAYELRRRPRPQYTPRISAMINRAYLYGI